MGNKILFILMLFVIFFEVTGYNPHNLSADISKGVIGSKEVSKSPSIVQNILPDNILNSAMNNINKLMPQIKDVMPGTDIMTSEMKSIFPEIDTMIPQINSVLPGMNKSFKSANNYASMAPSLLILVFVILIFRRIVAIVSYFSRR